ncbi:BrnA antitoxin family protein [Bradyrhizobium sp.]|uniref:BrnA antitoxin family protein n=1 Tax=Bradyrhizobium sp. TaxID=376 RepID=UPI003C73173D
MASRKKADADNPEWTRDDFAKAKTPGDVLPADVLSKFGKHRGPQKAPKKVPVSIRLSPIVVTHFRNQGPGWQARIDAVLTRIVKKEKRPDSTRIRRAG